MISEINKHAFIGQASCDVLWTINIDTILYTQISSIQIKEMCQGNRYTQYDPKNLKKNPMFLFPFQSTHLPCSLKAIAYQANSGT